MLCDQVHQTGLARLMLSKLSIAFPLSLLKVTSGDAKENRTSHARELQLSAVVLW